jgi:hypothetical protein
MKDKKKNPKKVNENYTGQVDPQDYPYLFRVLFTLLVPFLGIVYILVFAKNKPFARKWYIIAMITGFFLYLLILAFIFINYR